MLHSGWNGASVDGIDLIVREIALFAAVGLLIGGIDDLLIDGIFIVRRMWRGGPPRLKLATLPPAAKSDRIVVLVPAWDEATVIAPMLRAALTRYRHDDYAIHVGLYPNDLDTIAAVRSVADRDHRIRPVIGDRFGPTSKADCLNTLWRDLAATGSLPKAIVFHDAEDLVHPAELIVFDTLIERHAVVQLPVLPLVRGGSRLMSGHYADEFAESHLRTLVVRTALGAGLPLAGTGCAIRPDVLARLAALRGGDPFDPTCMVEDYELGLAIARLGESGIFARVGDGEGGVVAVSAYFPDTLAAAVRQKARWMCGIALSGWDRTGWSRPGAFGDHWMRMKDRSAPLAVLVLTAAYAALLFWPLAALMHWIEGSVPPPPATLLVVLLQINTALLAWRCVMRVVFTARVYGWRESLWSVPRLVVGNAVAMLAARRALGRYLLALRGVPPVWDKTVHTFPDVDPVERA